MMERNRSLGELLAVSKPAWPAIEGALRQASNLVEILPGDASKGESAVLRLQLFADTALGAVVLNTGGLLVDGGWLRVLGSGSGRLPATVLNWNGLEHPPRFAGLTGAIIVAFDVLGGIFAVNAGALPGDPGSVAYLSPDVLDWHELASSYSGFLAWVAEGDLSGFYNTMRWDDWEEDVEPLSGDQGLHRNPPPWTIMGQRTRDAETTVMTMPELIGAHVRRVGPKQAPKVPEA